jgi:hypothetical protein
MTEATTGGHRRRSPEVEASYYQRYRDRNARYIYAYLLEHPCVDCGEADPIVLDFDHVRGKKLCNVSHLLSGTPSLKRIQAEIDKCEVRCANCHRRVTAQRHGWFAYLSRDPVVFVDGRQRSSAPCGTQAAYRRGCKCEKCLAHQARRLRVWRAKRKWERQQQQLGAGPSRLTGAA